jgi:hypothetical protein
MDPEAYIRTETLTEDGLVLKKVVKEGDVPLPSSAKIWILCETTINGRRIGA